MYGNLTALIEHLVLSKPHGYHTLNSLFLIMYLEATLEQDSLEQSSNSYRVRSHEGA